MNREAIAKQLETKRDRLAIYLAREKEMLTGGAQSYGIGSRSLTRYQTDLSNVRAAIKELEADIALLEGQLTGQSVRKSVSVVIRDL